MKKLLLAIAIVAFGFTANAQKAGFNLGANAGYNFDSEAFSLSLESNYLFDLSDEFKLGPSASYYYTFFDTPKGAPSVSKGMFTAAAAARFNASEEFVIGADLGVGFIGSTTITTSLGKVDAGNGSSDFYYRPLIGYMVSDSSMLQLSYSGVGKSGSLNLGIMFGL